MRSKPRYCGQLQNHVRIAKFRGENSKNVHTPRIFVCSQRASQKRTGTSFWKNKKITIERRDPLFALSERNWYPNNHMRSMEWKQLSGKTSWKYLSSVMNRSSVFNAQKICVFSDSVLCLGKIHENPQSNKAWEDRLTWFKSSPEYRNFDRIDGEAIEFEWNIFPGIHHVVAQPQSPRVTVEIEWNTTKIHRTDYLHVDVQRHLMGIKRQQERMRVKCSTRVSICEKIRSRTMVISRTWIIEKVVFYQWR